MGLMDLILSTDIRAHVVLRCSMRAIKRTFLGTHISDKALRSWYVSPLGREPSASPEKETHVPLC